MSLAEVSKELGIPPNTLRWWRHIGRGPKSFALGQRIYYRADDIDGWVAEQYNASGRGQA